MVILHEEAEEGKIIEDLTGPVAAVGAAVKNLVEVCQSILNPHAHFESFGNDACSIFPKRENIIIHKSTALDVSVLLYCYNIIVPMWIQMLMHNGFLSFGMYPCTVYMTYMYLDMYMYIHLYTSHLLGHTYTIVYYHCVIHHLGFPVGAGW